MRARDLRRSIVRFFGDSMSDDKTPQPVVVNNVSTPPPREPKSTAQLVAETLVDLVAIAVVGGLAFTGKVSGEFALGLVALLGGVRVSDIVGSRTAGAGGGLAALVLGALHSHGSHVAMATIASAALVSAQ